MFKWLIKCFVDDDTIWVDKNGNTLRNPWSSQLFDFCVDGGFSTEEEAIESNISLVGLFNNKCNKAQIVALSIY
jgi:hypothetical protein